MKTMHLECATPEYSFRLVTLPTELGAANSEYTVLKWSTAHGNLYIYGWETIS